MQTQTARQWMITHEWMVNPMQQTEWIERQGMLVWLSEVFSALGTGLYLVALFVNSWWGALIGYAVVMFLKLPLHLLYLGKPLRFWRTMPHFQMHGRHHGLQEALFSRYSSAVLAFCSLLSPTY